MPSNKKKSKLQSSNEKGTPMSASFVDTSRSNTNDRQGDSSGPPDDLVNGLSANNIVINDITAESNVPRLTPFNDTGSSITTPDIDNASAIQRLEQQNVELMTALKDLQNNMTPTPSSKIKEKSTSGDESLGDKLDTLIDLMQRYMKT